MTRLLFVDNDAASLVLFEEICTMISVESVCFQKPSQLIAKLPQVPQIDAAFIDLEMPSITGYEVLTLLRADPRFQQIPIVACTVYVGEVERAYLAGFTGFITKPINIDRFSEQITAILNGQAVWERHSN